MLIYMSVTKRVNHLNWISRKVHPVCPAKVGIISELNKYFGKFFEDGAIKVNFKVPAPSWSGLAEDSHGEYNYLT